MAAIVGSQPSGREAGRLRWFTVAVLEICVFVLYIFFDILLTDKLNQKIPYREMLALVITDAGQVAFWSLIIRGILMFIPTFFQVVVVGIKEFRNYTPIGTKKHKIGVLIAFTPPVWAYDIYSDYIEYRKVISGSFTALASCLMVSTGFEALLGGGLYYLWENKYVLYKSDAEIEQMKRERKAKKELIETEGQVGGRLAAVPFGGFLVGIGLGVIVLGALIMVF